MSERLINVKKQFMDVPVKYRPIPFWSWNEKLDAAETTQQIEQMCAVGIGGFFMHARGGLQTEYMGEEWFDNVTAAVEAAKRLGMRPWAYDENGWPSGFGNGTVNGLGVAYQQKYLRMETENNHEDTFIGKCGDHFFYYEVNPFYVDTLDKKVTEAFIKCTYEPYYERYGKQIEGFFTDEPQISRSGIPWSFVFEEEYCKRYGENILDVLEQLFLPLGDYVHTRVKFWKMVTELFSESYMKQIYQWCEERGLKLTGHLLLEESLLTQLTTGGACMPHYEYFHIPGMDWLGRDIRDCLTIHQLASVAEQTGKEAVISETFALCGHNVSFAELKGIYEWQMVRGVNLLCQHLEGYSLRGIRKRDYPPAMYVQQPWWTEYDKFVEAMSREGMVLSEGEHRVDVLVLHPQTTAWALFDNDKNEGLEELNDHLLQVIKTLERKHIEFHLGDEILMERHGRVENGKLVIGRQAYGCVIVECSKVLLDSTRDLLSRFIKSGGKITTADELEKNNVVDQERITYTKRFLEGSEVHYFVNTTPEYVDASFSVSGNRLDIYTGELIAFDGEHRFEPWGSVMILADRAEKSGPTPEQHDEHKAENGTGHMRPTVKANETATHTVRPTEVMRIVGSTLNALTLDKCDYYFDGQLQEKNGYVLNICERANRLERPVHIRQEYEVIADYVPEYLCLVCETPDKFRILINGLEMEKRDTGYYRDKSFRKLDISGAFREGSNQIVFECDFRQSEEFYRNRKKSMIFESEKNKLVYDMEIEPVYLLGDFSVRTDGQWEDLPHTGMRYRGDFVLDKPKKELNIKHIEKQGYPFFCGELVLEGEICVTDKNSVLELDMKGINAVKVQIGKKEKVLLTHGRISLQEFDIKGKTTVRLTLINNLRNLLGPHHLKEGESLRVVPGSFFKETCVWNQSSDIPWDEDYCFVETGI